MSKRISKRITVYIILLLMALGLGYYLARRGLTNGIEQPPPLSQKEPPEEPNEPEDPIRKQIEAMSLEEKVGQLVIVGIDGPEFDDNSKRLIEEYHVGGFIFFKRNLQNSRQMLELLNSLKRANAVNKVPLFLSIDEEGGQVSRLPAEFMKFPASGKVGDLADSKLAYQLGSVLGQVLKSSGFNLNFAPVLDINSNPRNPVIGDRSFGSKAELVSSLGIATMQGLQEAKVIPVVKHFPGHGDTSVDSHVGLPILEHDLARLKSVELLPFQEAIENKAEAIMIAHILLPAIDSEYPSSLSQKIITDILREQMGFEGVVISDDLTMGAIADNYDIGEAAVTAVLAGCDIVLVCHGTENEEKVLQSLLDGVKTGLIPLERIEDSLYRILSLKEKYLTDQPITEINVEALNEKINTVLRNLN